MTLLTSCHNVRSTRPTLKFRQKWVSQTGPYSAKWQPVTSTALHMVLEVVSLQPVNPKNFALFSEKTKENSTLRPSEILDIF